MYNEGIISYVTTLEDFLIKHDLFYSQFGSDRNILILAERKIRKINSDALLGLDTNEDFDILKSLLLPNSYSFMQTGTKWDLVTLTKVQQRNSHIRLYGLIFPDFRIQNPDSEIDLGGSQILGNLLIDNQNTSGSDVKINGFLCSGYEEVHQRVTDDEEIDMSNFDKVERYG